MARAYSQVHALLDNREFPYSFKELSNTVVANEQFDIDRGAAQITSGSEAHKNKGYCHSYFLENVLPISRGYKSVAFLPRVPEIPEGAQDIITQFTISGPQGRLAIFAASLNTAYVFDPAVGSWQVSPMPTNSDREITCATIREVTYIHLGYGIFVYNFSTRQLEELYPLGLSSASATMGVTAAGPYLILWDSQYIYYSSILNPMDFTPSLATGAGSTGVLPLRGRIVGAVSLGQDFIIHTTQNAVSARQTGNTNFPFVFKEVTGSAGVQKLQHVAYNSNVGSQVLWTNSGFQSLSLEGAEYIWPELSDGIRRKLAIRMDPWLHIPEMVNIPDMDVNVKFCSNRYICVSTGSVGNYQDCYVYDTNTARWGKLTLPHLAALEFTLPTASTGGLTYGEVQDRYGFYAAIQNQGLTYRGVSPDAIQETTAGRNLAIINSRGKVYELSLEATWESIDDIPAPKVVLGRYKISRSSGVTLQWIKANSVEDANITIYSHSYIGIVFQRAENLVKKSPQPGQYFGMVSGDSLSIEFSGEFTLTELTIALSNAGSINQLRDMLQEETVLTTIPFPVPPEPPEFVIYTSERASDGLYRLLTRRAGWEFIVTHSMELPFECNKFAICPGTDGIIACTRSWFSQSGPQIVGVVVDILTGTILWEIPDLLWDAGYGNSWYQLGSATPGLKWSPDGQRLGVYAYSSGNNQFELSLAWWRRVVIYNRNGIELFNWDRSYSLMGTTHWPLPSVTTVGDFAFNPVNNQIAYSNYAQEGSPWQFTERSHLGIYDNTTLVATSDGVGANASLVINAMFTTGGTHLVYYTSNELRIRDNSTGADTLLRQPTGARPNMQYTPNLKYLILGESYNNLLISNDTKEVVARNAGLWSTFAITPDSRYIIAANHSYVFEIIEDGDSVRLERTTNGIVGDFRWISGQLPVYG